MTASLPNDGRRTDSLPPGVRWNNAAPHPLSRRRSVAGGRRPLFRRPLRLVLGVVDQEALAADLQDDVGPFGLDDGPADFLSGFLGALGCNEHIPNCKGPFPSDREKT